MHKLPYALVRENICRVADQNSNSYCDQLPYKKFFTFFFGPTIKFLETIVIFLKKNHNF